MPGSPQAFIQRLADLKAQISAQGRRVQALIEAAFDAAFNRDAAGADRIERLDETVDRVDVDIEKACVQLLTEATAAGAALDPDQLRAVLVIVKVNNELERIADLGVRVAARVKDLPPEPALIPETFRVLANSVIGILRDANTCLERGDPRLAKVVLASEDAVESFKRALLRDLQGQLAAGRKMAVDYAFTLQELASACEAMADHCTNIAEQVIYASTGAIVRHMEKGWEEVPQP
jgi:phosphate transport system protein